MQIREVSVRRLDAVNGTIAGFEPGSVSHLMSEIDIAQRITSIVMKTVKSRVIPGNAIVRHFLGSLVHTLEQTSFVAVLLKEAQGIFLVKKFAAAFFDWQRACGFRSLQALRSNNDAEK